MHIRYHLFAVLSLLATLACPIAADEEFSLVIDPFTGLASLRNDGPGAVELDSYFITSSANPLLQIDTWSSLEDGGQSGWRETSSETGNRLGELNLFESLAIPANSSVSIGQPYPVFEPSELGEPEPALSSISFSYTLANESTKRRGDVEFSSRNTVVLVVDPATGQSQLENQSGFDVDLDSYLLKSTPNVLNPEGWQPLSGTDDAWASASGHANRVSEGNLFASTKVDPNGGSLSLGTPIDPALLNDEKDIAVEFTTSDFASTIKGGVLFRTLGDLDPADCNGDGVVDINDANCAEDLNAFLTSINSIQGDVDGDGEVQFPDFLVLSTNFGQAGNYTDGNLDRAGTIDFTDFLILSSNFGQTGGAASVPEPAGSLMLTIVLAVALGCRRRR